jgi:glycosyltransferase involved in cell wall biosynthesis
MKKLLVCAYCCVSESGVLQVGGEAELGFNLVKQFSRFFQVTVLTHAHNQKAIEEVLKKEPLNNVVFVYIQLPTFLRFLEKFHKGGIQIYSYLWQIKAYFVAKKLHQQESFDAFWHTTYANDWMASYIGALLPVPYFRGPGGGAHFVPKAFTKHYTLKQKLGEWARHFGQWVFRHDPFFIMGQKRAKALLVCNQEAFNALPKDWQKKAHFFPVNGISSQDLHFLRSVEKASRRNFLVLTAGKLITIKSVDLAMKAFKMFHEKIPNSEFLILGDGPEMAHLQKLASELGLKKNIIFLGWQPREKLLTKMQEADVFLFTSLRDGGGAVIVEAMAAEKPIVCFDISGPGFHVKPEWGIKVAPENPAEALLGIAEALEKLYIDSNQRIAMGRNARQRAESFYLWDHLGNTLYDIYRHAQ